MQIRKATSSDAQQISYLIKKNADHVLIDDYTKAQLSAWKRANSLKRIIENMANRTTFVAFQNNELVGTIGLEGDYLVGLYISYHKRGQGLGYKLLVYLEQYAKRLKICQLYLTSTPNGYGFYKKYGYKSIGTVKLNYDGVEVMEAKMTKKLSHNQENIRLDFNAMPWENIEKGMGEKKVLFGNKQIRYLKFECGFIEKEWCHKPHFGFVLKGQFKIDFKGKKLTYKKGDGINIQGGSLQLHKAIIEKGGYVELILIDN